MTKELKKIVAVVGPTAVGKSEIAKAIADEFHGFLISADSRMLYQGMDIGTNKPSQIERTRYRYEMIDIIKPDEEFSLALYQEQVFNVIDQAEALPILEGGTGLYISSVVDNLEIPKVKPNQQLRERLEKQSAEDLYQQLQAIDPRAAEVIDPQNKRRVVRALETKLMGGQSQAAPQKLAPRYEALMLGVERPREELYQRINDRVEEMFERGLVEEVQGLVDAGYSWSLPALSSIGYQEIGQFLRQEISLDEAKKLMKKNTRHYARRQLTWFRRDQRIKWIKSVEEAIKLTQAFITS